MDKLTVEREYFAQGYPYVAGVDEVGRGPLAGPVVCAAVILPLSEEEALAGINDSKKLSAKKREQLAERIKHVALGYCICETDEKVIDRINILQATRLCMKRAVEGLGLRPDFVLTDGNMTLDIDIPQKSIIKGISRSVRSALRVFLQKCIGMRLCANMQSNIPGTVSNEMRDTERHNIFRRFGRLEYVRFIEKHS